MSLRDDMPGLIDNAEMLAVGGLAGRCDWSTKSASRLWAAIVRVHHWWRDAELYRHQCEVLTRENDGLRADIERLTLELEQQV